MFMSATTVAYNNCFDLPELISLSSFPAPASTSQVVMPADGFFDAASNGVSTTSSFVPALRTPEVVTKPAAQLLKD